MPNPELPFPLVERKVYANNPLAEVVCELRFPTILRIDAETPADFQERVRKRFPKFSRQSPPPLPELPAEVAEALSGTLPTPALSFQDEDGLHGITLSSGKLAINCVNYESWDRFKADIDLALKALAEVYEPSYFERVGLRYVNIIDRSKLDLNGAAWAELLNPRIAGELVEKGWADNVLGVRKSILLRIPKSDDHVHVQHGLGHIDGSELSYILDFDYSYSQKAEITDVYGVVERLHGYSGSAFQWSISERLKLALG